MKPSTSCAAIEAELVAAATGEGSSASADRIRRHLGDCARCRELDAEYRELGAVVAEIRSDPVAEDVGALGRLRMRIADARSTVLRYAILSSPLGPILIAVSDLGIAWIEYLDDRGLEGSILFDRVPLHLESDESLRRLGHDIAAYLAGRRNDLEWSPDLRLASSDFQRRVLLAASRIPYGAVSSYAGIAADLGRPAAVRAVAQALRRNPLPIVVPCHRVVGSDGALVGYAGNRVGLKERLLGAEGIRVAHRGSRARIDRGSMYAWDRRGREFCLPTCGDVARRPIGPVTLFATARDALGAGLVPCGDCRPDRHPPLGGAPDSRDPG